MRGLRKSFAPISGFVSPSDASRAICDSCAVRSSRVSSVRLRAVSPVAASSRRARSANPGMPMSLNISYAVRSCSRASSRRPSRLSHSPYRRCARARSGRVPARPSRSTASRTAPRRRQIAVGDKRRTAGLQAKSPLRRHEPGPVFELVERDTPPDPAARADSRFDEVDQGPRMRPRGVEVAGALCSVERCLVSPRGVVNERARMLAERPRPTPCCSSSIRAELPPRRTATRGARPNRNRGSHGSPRRLPPLPPRPSRRRRSHPSPPSRPPTIRARGSIGSAPDSRASSNAATHQRLPALEVPGRPRGCLGEGEQREIRLLERRLLAERDHRLAKQICSRRISLLQQLRPSPHKSSRRAGSEAGTSRARATAL